VETVVQVLQEAHGGVSVTEVGVRGQMIHTAALARLQQDIGIRIWESG
jgi:hypothetical protein